MKKYDSEYDTEMKKEVRKILEYNTDDRGHIHTDDTVLDLCDLIEDWMEDEGGDTG